jgi:hypothetical protein
MRFHEVLLDVRGLSLVHRVLVAQGFEDKTGGLAGVQVVLVLGCGRGGGRGRVVFF